MALHTRFLTVPNDAVGAQPREERQGFPMAVGNACRQTPPLRAPTAQRRHVRAKLCFVAEVLAQVSSMVSDRLSEHRILRPLENSGFGELEPAHTLPRRVDPRVSYGINASCIIPALSFSDGVLDYAPLHSI
jgi:hypothetical protein